MHLYGGQVSGTTSGQHKQRVKRPQAEHRKTYLFLGSSTQHPEQEKTEQDNINGEEKSKKRRREEQEKNE